MATMTITIPDEEIGEFVDYICEDFQYQELVYAGDPEPVPNPESKSDFAKRMIRQNLHDGFKGYKERKLLLTTGLTTGIDVT